MADNNERAAGQSGRRGEFKDPRMENRTDDANKADDSEPEQEAATRTYSVTEQTEQLLTSCRGERCFVADNP